MRKTQMVPFILLFTITFCSSGCGSGDPNNNNPDADADTGDDSDVVGDTDSDTEDTGYHDADLQVDADDDGDISEVPTTLSITQFGITWTFDREYPYGQFTNGDYWIVGPVNIVEIDPASIEIDGRTVHGSMINPSPEDGSTQGYDSETYGIYGPNWDPNMNFARPGGSDLSNDNPLTIDPGSSLCSSISLIPAQLHEGSETLLHCTDIIAILTILDSPAPPGSFRPPYSGSDKNVLYNQSDLRTELLRTLEPVDSTPSISVVESYFEKPWIDHVPGWGAEVQHPIGNMPNYGGSMSRQIGVGALMLHLDYSLGEKQTLLARYIQLGIDLYGVVADGGVNNWRPDGGHASGRKWPILFAGVMLDDENMTNIGQNPEVFFGEDAQTFYVEAETLTSGTGYSTEDIGLPEYGIRHATHPHDDVRDWETAPYRRCCTATAWGGFILAALMMDQKENWNHEALFDYQDRYMLLEQTEWRQTSDFAENMWDAYRSDYGNPWTP